LLVVGFGMGDIRGMALCSDLTEEPERIGLVSTFLVRMGALEGTLGECNRVLLAVRQEICLTQPGDIERLLFQKSQAVDFFQRPLKQWEVPQLYARTEHRRSLRTQQSE
jgi:hypothetical protein